MEWLGTDKYGRTLGHVYADSRHVNLESVAEGYDAWHYKEYKSDPQLANAETGARRQRLGLWSKGSPVAPWEFRHAA